MAATANFVQELAHGSINNGATTSQAITLTATAAVGHTVVLIFNARDTSAAGLSVADSRGNTWTVDRSSNSANNFVMIASTDQTVAHLQSGDTVTITFGTAPGNSRNWWIEELSGLFVSSQDVGTTNSGAGGTPATTGTTASTSQAEEIAIAACCLDVGTAPTSFTASGSGFTAFPTGQQVTTGGVDGFNKAGACGYQVLHAAGTQQATFTWGGGATGWTAIIQTYKAAILPPPKLYYRLDDPSGTTATDASANANNGTYVNAPTLGAAGAITDGDAAVTFASASSQCVSIPYVSADHDVGDVFTIVAWFKAAAAAQMGIFSLGHATNSGPYLRISGAAGHIEILKSNTSSLGTTAGSNLCDGNYHMVVWTKSAATNKIYVDNVDVTPAIANATMTNSGQNPHIGSDISNGVASDFFNGSVDEVALYAVAAAASNVQSLWDAGLQPFNTVIPAISGTLSIGSLLTATTGTWTGSGISYAYQWQKDDVDIGGATSSTYTVASGDAGHSLRVNVTATNTHASLIASSSETPIVAGPTNTVPPVASGLLTVGSVLSCTTGTWTGSPTSYSYQWWQVGNAPILGATSASYTVTGADPGFLISCVVSATNAGGTTAASSNGLGPILAPSSSVDVPEKYDVIIDGFGYVFWKALMPNMPFRTQRAAYYYHPTFLERTNVGANYGDDSQAFWLTATQNDWSEGAGRRFFRSTDSDLTRRFWLSQEVDPVAIPGQVSLSPQEVVTIPYGSNQIGACAGGPGSSYGVFSAETVNAGYLKHQVGTSYAIVGLGAHGCGNTPSLWSLCHDGKNFYLSSTGAGTVGVRTCPDGGAFSTFSAQSADSLIFLNNTLYGYLKSNSTLYTYSTAGVATSSFQWKDAAGGTISTQGMLAAFGGKLLILRYYQKTELWEYDGTGVAMQTDFPNDFIGAEIKVVAGVAFISGLTKRGGHYYPTIFYFANGTLGQLWQSVNPALLDSLNCYPAMCAYGEGLAFTDDSTGRVFQYDIAFGGVRELFTYGVTTDPSCLAGSPELLMLSRNTTTNVFYPDTVINTTGFIRTSLFDFDNSLPKVPRGIKVEFDSATDGDGGSVDISYAYDSVDGAYTPLTIGAVSGQEYVLPTTQCHSISVEVTLHRGTSTKGPVLKRIFTRAAPLLTTYRRVEYVVDLTGAAAAGGVISDPVQLRNGQDCTLTGLQMANNLKASIVSNVPVQVTDAFGTFTAVFEQGPGITEFDEYRPGEYISKLTLREV